MLSMLFIQTGLHMSMTKRLKELGAYAFIPKPMSYEDLISFLSR
jgi:FixJ family two-component response regulator